MVKGKGMVDFYLYTAEDWSGRVEGGKKRTFLKNFQICQTGKK